MIDYLIDLATAAVAGLMIRLVKGAHWDSEIKRAQMDGLEGYPVYTARCIPTFHISPMYEKAAGGAESNLPAVRDAQRPYADSDLSPAGRKLLSGSVRVPVPAWYGRATVMSRSPGKLPTANSTVRVADCMLRLARMKTLLAYLVRRLLKAVANTSFVNRIADTLFATG